MKEIYGKIAIVLSLIAITLYVVDNSKEEGNTQKIGVVEMEELVYEYQGMKDATGEYTEKMNAWSAQADTMKEKLNGLLYEIKLDSINGDDAKLLRDQQKFMLLRQSFIEYQQNIKQKAQEEDQQMTIGIMNQIKEHIKSYAEKEGYAIIISNTQMQNIGYASSAKDLTKIILDYSNSRYEGEE